MQISHLRQKLRDSLLHFNQMQNPSRKWRSLSKLMTMISQMKMLGHQFIYLLPESKPTPPPSPCAPLSRPTTPPGPSPPQSEFEPEEVPTNSKRNHRSPSPEPKKVKKQITSAIRHALELSTAEVGNGQGTKHGLLKYFLKGTEKDRKAYFLREDELYNEVRLQAVVDAKNAGARKRVQERDLAREH